MSLLQEPVVVTGPRGRLGRAVLASLGDHAIDSVGVGRPDYDLDYPDAARRLVAARQPGLVFHAAAWTDVDECARQPELAMRRNAVAVAELARACATAGVGLVLMSTNEVFDGERTDGLGYVEDDPPQPINPYGASKLEGERAALAEFARADATDRLWIVRTAWLFGPPGNDFPAKIIAAASQLAAGQPLRVVSDEIGTPTYTVDFAPALISLVAGAPAGVYHLVAAGIASRYEVAAEVVGRCVPGAALTPISRREFNRASVAPQWAVLDASRASSFGVTLPNWRPAISSYLGALCPAGRPS